LLEPFWLTLSSPINKSVDRDIGNIDCRRKIEMRRVIKCGK
jgi:hypothetical protein